jgi:hypothetical protein
MTPELKARALDVALRAIMAETYLVLAAYAATTAERTHKGSIGGRGAERG